MSVFHNNVLSGAAGQGGAAAAEYVIPKSLRFNSGDSAHLSKTFASAGNRRTWTWSGWVKKSEIISSGDRQIFGSDSSGGAEFNGIAFVSTNALNFRFNDSGSLQIRSSALHRDPGAWMHIVCVADTTQSTASDRLKMYVNGVQVTDFSSSTYPAQNAESSINSTQTHEIGRRAEDGGQYFNGYLADIQFVDGQALTADDFGETRSSDGVWVPKEASFTSPNNGTTWSSDLTATSSGAYFASGAGAADAFDGNLDNSAQSEPNGSTITFSPTGGIAVSTSLRVYRGSDSTSNTVNVSVNGGSAVTFARGSWVDLSFTGTLTSLAVSSPSANPGLSAVEVDGVILIDGAGTYGKNGFHLNFSDSSTNEALGYDSAATVPDLDPKKGMDVVTYTGNGGTQNIGGLNFEPGLVWIKQRNEARYHAWYDSVRGPDQLIRSSGTNAEVDAAGTGLIAFNPDGFNLSTDNGANKSSGTYVAWTWRAGGPAVSNTDGTITTQVSANTDYGFSIIKYTGVDNSSAQTIGHGLGAVPKWVIVKNLTDAEDWAVYHASVGSTKYLQLNNSTAAATSSAYWNDTDPTSTVITLNNSNDVQRINRDYIVYAWSEISGYSKFGSYNGSGSANTKVTTGFKPKFIIARPINDSNGNRWHIVDTERGVGGTAERLFAEDSTVHSARQEVLIEDDGFIVTNTTTDSGSLNRNTEYIYAAFADRPGNNWDVNNLVTNEGLSTSKDNFDVVTYTGNGSTQSIDSLEFQPDFVWIKNRGSVENHSLNDSVRGVNKQLQSSSTSAESTHTNQLTSFNSNGFTVGSSSQVNENNVGQVAWCWKAGGTAVSNTDGSITSSVSANAAYGFSIVSYTGTGSNATVGHGLNTAPKLVIARTRDRASNWAVYHGSVGNMATGYLYLNSTNGFKTDASDIWNSVDPTSSVFSIGTAGAINTDDDDHIAYCFTDVPGYQRFGSYTGNGSSSGPVIVTGFKPRFLLAKKTSADGRQWLMLDSQRNPSNPLGNRLYAENTAADDSANIVNFVDNGFEIISATSDLNDSGATYIYWAIGDDEIGSNEDCLVDVPNAVTADADATDTTGGYQRGNYCTLNAVDNNGGTLSNGNLKITTTGASNVSGTIGMPSGKYYWEVTIDRENGGVIGIGAGSAMDGTALTDLSKIYGYSPNGQKYENGTGSSYGATYTAGDIISVKFDAGTGQLEFLKNYSSQGVAFTVDSEFVYFPQLHLNNTDVTVNWGQMRFKYGLPSGYAALNTTALPAATIEDGSKYFDTVLYTGTGAAKTISGLNLSPDMAWIKERNDTNWHRIIDAVRGQKEVFPNATNTESSFSQGLNSFNSDGFTLGTGSDSNVNTNNNTYVAWLWDAGSSNTTISAGSLNSSVYDQSQTWSTYGSVTSGSFSPAITELFDNDLTSGPSTGPGTTSTWTFTSGITASSSIEIYCVNGSGPSGTQTSGTEIRLTVGGTVHSINGSPGWINTGLTGSLTAVTIHVTAGSGSSGLRAIKVDGKELVDSGLSVTNVPSIASTVRANPTAGFSIAKWSGSDTNYHSVAHGLNAKPDLMIFKQTNQTYNWHVYHSALGATKALRLNLTAAELDDAGFLNDTEPTSSVFTTGNWGIWDANADTVGYFFSAVPGYSAIGSVETNGTTDNAFIYLGFKAKFIMFKRIDSTGNWTMWDTSRNTYNVMDKYLFANTAGAEGTDSQFDILSNGIKIRTAGFASGATFIYYAVAENPFVANGGLAR